MAQRLDTVQQFDPGSPTPIGTLTEVRAMGLSPLKYGSCSMPGRNNIGCKHYDDANHGPCPILQLCRAKNRKGYERVAFVRILSPVNMKQDACMCHQFMDTMAHADPRNGVTHILGLGGDVTIKRRETRLVEPGNARSKSRVVLVPEKIEPAPRPDESMAERAANIQLVREMNAKSAKAMAEGMGSLVANPHSLPEEDTVEAEEGLDANALDDDMDSSLDSEGGLDDVLGDEDGFGEEEPESDPEPAAVRAVSGRGRGRPRKSDG